MKNLTISRCTYKKETVFNFFKVKEDKPPLSQKGAHLRQWVVDWQGQVSREFVVFLGL